MVGVASLVLAVLGAAQLVKHIPGPVKASLECSAEAVQVQLWHALNLNPTPPIH